MADEVTEVVAEEKAAVPAKFASLVETIEQLSVLDLAELVKVLEDKFGVSAAAPMMMGGMMPAGGEAGGAEEKTSFDVELSAIGESKINVIKVVKELLGLGLKEAKDLVDGAPAILKAGVAKDEAEAIKAKITEAGGAVTLK
ncbi:50S ribosomal protein L7/L12 [Candidatus Uhrbacteria bacterium CG10_big_fil_rev_8_21_14_0_10_50_16]|uniref:Large ribosomal subunit protein bL12 n=1 Tax=Candidatus Uhrbacteria bacterium CG10_big_fil_rev_8_21_14_0_10_50_16 TaxID=1975039 RepID=A0A2H0RNL0_9BACT|nr:MAG: 50S ribosomal protein L7/L12 [Candidatus Uhrbacteria bacterium CG10_big_fil_rev_8_21_14_0_10_50_16]